jgi:hypothetical protein
VTKHMQTYRSNFSAFTTLRGLEVAFVTSMYVGYGRCTVHNKDNPVCISTASPVCVDQSDRTPERKRTRGQSFGGNKAVFSNCAVLPEELKNTVGHSAFSRRECSRPLVINSATMDHTRKWCPECLICIVCLSAWAPCGVCEVIGASLIMAPTESIT